MSDKKKEQNSVTITIDASATSSTDIVYISTRSDNSILMRFLSMLPEAGVENHRTVINGDTAKSLAKLLCDATGYYPKKASKKKAAPKKTAKKTLH